MRKAALVSVCATAVAGVVALGCSGAEGPTTGSTSGGSAASGRSPVSISGIDNTARPNLKGPGQVLATVTTSNKHTFVFGQSASGATVVAESMPAHDTQMLDREMTSGSITDVYRRLTNGLTPPAALIKAEAESPKHEAATSLAAPPVGRPVEHVATALPGEPEFSIDFFRFTYCAPNYVSVCDEQNGPINASLGQWTYGANFDVWGYNYPGNSGTAALLEYVWTGSSWRFDWISGTINPGNVWYEWWFNTPEYRSAELSIQGEGGMAFGSPTFNATYDSGNSTFSFNIGGPNLSAVWPHDSGINCWETEPGFSHVTLGAFGTNLAGENFGIGGTCHFLGESDTNDKTVCCTGDQTGTTACARVDGPSSWNFNPGYCCASKGGHSAC